MQLEKIHEVVVPSVIELHKYHGGIHNVHGGTFIMDQIFLRFIQSSHMFSELLL